MQIIEVSDYRGLTVYIYIYIYIIVIFNMTNQGCCSSWGGGVGGAGGSVGQHLKIRC